MKSLSVTGAMIGKMVGALLMATALTPAGAADMTFERGLNVGKEPQNWLLHHGNYQGHRFSQLKDINTENVKALKLAFTVALGGFEGAGTRYKFGNLEATPIVEDGVMYVQQSGRGAVEGQGDLDLARRPHVRNQQGDRREGVGAQDR